ncbi:MAG: immunoglobulin domain-containing protein, partial [Verrucomicrobia bacterium]|nr:immunoglobulin domain-containing protein [Verrucomicrobiota bacterium]
VAWGGNSSGQTTVPAGLSGVTAIAAGGSYFLSGVGYTLALATPRAPVILTQPQSRTVSIGQGADFFTVSASGMPFPTYQWFKNGTPISGATGTVLSLGPAQAIHAGSYTVVASNPLGSVVSAPPAVLTVNAAYGGRVVAWGDNYYGEAIVPAGLSGVTAIAAGDAHTVALKSAGTVVAWGDNSYGEVIVPAGLSGVTAIAAGVAHTVALKSAGTVVVWGDNTSGQMTVPIGLSGVTAIAAGYEHTVALKGAGTVVAWGGNSSGQTTVPAGLSGVTAIAAGGDHTVALKSDGTVVAWGYNASGEATVPAGLSGVTAIAAGGYHTVALKSDGTVVAWGYNGFGEATVPAGLSGVMAIAAGSYYTVALKSAGTVVAWGYKGFGETTVLAGLSGVIAIAAGGYYTVALGQFPSASISGPDSVLPSTPFNLTADVTGDQPIFHQWQRSGVNLPGATAATLTVSAGEPGLGAVTYSVVVRNAYGSSVALAPITVANPIRRLPTGYWPQVPFVVEIDYAPRQGVLNHAIVDNLPTASITQLVPELFNQAGAIIAYKLGTNTVSLQPTLINEGGLWDPSTATVKWGPFFDDTPRVLSYTLTPPAGWDAPIAFSGSLSQDGVSSPLPSQTLDIYPLHPADNAFPANKCINFFERSAYATAWKRGLLWPVGPNPIPVDYVTQAGVIWRRGVYYEHVGGAAPLCWQPATPPPGFVVKSKAPVDAPKPGGSVHPKGITTSGTATRTMPSVVNPAAQFDVSLTITPDATTVDQAVEEQLPSGWQAINITSGGSVDTYFNQVKWGPFSDATTRTLTYTAVPPAGINGAFTLSGLAAFDGNVVTISGQSNVALGPIPMVIAHPKSQTTVAGMDVSFTVTAAGAAPLSYQWRKDGLDLPGQRTNALALTNVTRAQSGLYSVVVSNAFGNATSSNALLRVLVPQRLQSPQRLADGRFRLLFGDQDGGLLSLDDLASFEVDVSTNLHSANWFRFTNGFTLSNGLILFIDADATNYPRRFYRVIER